MQLALVLVNMLPAEPRQHFRAAGREITRGMATLVRQLADDVEKIAEETREDGSITFHVNYCVGLQAFI